MDNLDTEFFRLQQNYDKDGNKLCEWHGETCAEGCPNRTNR